jgi:hypothetical protein
MPKLAVKSRGIEEREREEKQNGTVKNSKLSRNKNENVSKKIILIGMIGNIIFGCMFYFFTKHNIEVANSIGIFNFFKFNLIFASLLFFSILTFLFGLTAYYIGKNQ